jgi:death-on-curing family protein
MSNGQMGKIIKLTKDEINKRIGENGQVFNKSNLEQIMDKLGTKEDIIDYATTTLYDIIALHPFLNGNKRTAFYAMTTFLDLNGVNIKYKKAEEDEIGIMLNKIALGTLNENKVSKLIKKMIL